MLAALADLPVARRRAVLWLAAAALAAAAVVGSGVVPSLAQGGFEDPGAEAVETRRVLAERFGAGPPNLVLLATAPDGSVDDADDARAGAELTRELAEQPGVAAAWSYWTTDSPALRSTGGDRALVLAHLEGSDTEVRASIDRLAPVYDGRTAEGLELAVGGEAQVYRQAGERIEHDLRVAEAIAVPITFLALVLVFGSVVAALLPVAVGVFATVVTFAVLRTITEAAPVSVFSLNLTTGLALGLAIDYSLFLLSRYREELADGREHLDAVRAAVRTAGRTVLFSAFTVALSLSAMLVFPQYVLRSFAYAGVAVTATAALGAVVLLPALIAALGPRRVEALDLRRGARRVLRRPERTSPATGTGWARLAHAVMRRPVPFGTAAVLLLLLLGAPFLRADFALSDDRVLPPGTSAAVVHDTLRAEFPSRDTGALAVLAADAPSGPARDRQIATTAERLSALPDVERVESAAGTFAGGRLAAPPDERSAAFARADGTWFTVVPAVDPLTADGERLVGQIREMPAPFALTVTGESAKLRDTMTVISDRLPVALGIIAVTTLVLLFLFTGSVVLPVKALVLNLLSLTAAFGAMVFVFQDGNLRWLVGDFTPTGTLDATTPVLMFCVLFGLSMDYEVFLLGRIKEQWDRTGDNRHAVATGLQQTGRIITAAALLLVIVFVAIATSGITFIKLLGVGVALAVIVDATIVRAVLVPSFMRLAGRANWWAPGPLRRLHDRIGLSEADVEPDPAPVRVPVRA